MMSEWPKPLARAKVKCLAELTNTFNPRRRIKSRRQTLLFAIVAKWMDLFWYWMELNRSMLLRIDASS